MEHGINNFETTETSNIAMPVNTTQSMVIAIIAARGQYVQKNV